MTREEQRRMNKSAGPADLPAREDKGPKVRGNHSRGIWPSLGVMPQSPLNLWGYQAWLVSLAGKIRPAGRRNCYASKKLFTAAPHKPSPQPYSRKNANPDGAGDALSLGLQPAVVPKVRPSHRAFISTTKNPKSLSDQENWLAPCKINSPPPSRKRNLKPQGG